MSNTPTPLAIPIHASVSLTLDAASQDLLALLQRLQARTTDTPTKAETNSGTNTPPAHGQYWAGQGGNYICTLPALLGLPARHLIAGREQTKTTFGPNEEITGASSPIDGPANTLALLNHGGHPAAKWAASYTADGHTDFHLPSKLDMVMAHICAPQLFDKEGWYWTSTQSSRDTAFVQDFEHGFSYWDGKGGEHRVRAFRWIQL